MPQYSVPVRRFLRRRRRSLNLNVVMDKRRKRAIKLLLFGAVLLTALVYGTIKLSILVRSFAEAQAKNRVTIAINEAAADKIASGDLIYSSLVTLEKDPNGLVTALVTNMAKINILQAEIMRSIIEKISDDKTSQLSIPLGNVIGSPYLSGRGPRIPVRIVSVGTAKAAFKNNFMAAGINQTRHQIILNTEVNVSVLTPGGITAVKVESQILVAETVIVGTVPGNYQYFEGSENWDTNLEKYDITH